MQPATLRNVQGPVQFLIQECCSPGAHAHVPPDRWLVGFGRVLLRSAAKCVRVCVRARTHVRSCARVRPCESIRRNATARIHAQRTTSTWPSYPHAASPHFPVIRRNCRSDSCGGLLTRPSSCTTVRPCAHRCSVLGLYVNITGGSTSIVRSSSVHTRSAKNMRARPCIWECTHTLHTYAQLTPYTPFLHSRQPQPKTGIQILEREAVCVALL